MIYVLGKPGIAHRDLKSKNILVKNDLTCCIADLGSFDFSTLSVWLVRVLCVCVCVCVCLCVCMYACVSEYHSAQGCTPHLTTMPTCICVCPPCLLCVCVCVCVYMCMYTVLCVYMCNSVYMYVYICV